MATPVTQATTNSMDDRQYAMLLHLSALAGLLIGFFFVGPLILWLVKRDSPFVDQHGRAAMDFHLSMLIYAVAGSLLVGLVAVFTLGLGVLLLLPVIILVALAAMVLFVLFPILAAVQANQGRPYRYPLSIPLLRRQ